MRMVAYHGTNKRCADAILQNGFMCKPNDEHWLGNGIYFFLDRDLAEWWAETPKKGFGTINRNPVLIEVNIEATEENTIDTRILEHYNWLGERFKDFMDFFHNMGTSIEETATPDQLRCIFFDWLHAYKGVDIVIAAFPKKRAKYIRGNIADYFYLPYIECQLCVFDNALIESLQVIHLERE